MNLICWWREKCRFKYLKLICGSLRESATSVYSDLVLEVGKMTRILSWGINQVHWAFTRLSFWPSQKCIGDGTIPCCLPGLQTLWPSWCTCLTLFRSSTYRFKKDGKRVLLRSSGGWSGYARDEATSRISLQERGLGPEKSLKCPIL